MKLKTPRERMLAVMTAIGSAHAGERLTPEQLLERLRDPAFRARFNGPMPSAVTFPDADTAALASSFQEAAVPAVVPLPLAQMYKPTR